MATKKVLVLNDDGTQQQMSSTDTVPLNNLGTGTPTSSNFLRGDGTWTIPGSGGVSFTTVEVDLGNTKRSGNFTIVSSGLTVNKQVMIYQATAPYTGKGTLADEAEMDYIGVTGVVTSTTTIKCFWNSSTSVKGNFKFNYLINT